MKNLILYQKWARTTPNRCFSTFSFTQPREFEVHSLFKDVGETIITVAAKGNQLFQSKIIGTKLLSVD